jgi:hypothetical protein
MKKNINQLFSIILLLIVIATTGWSIYWIVKSFTSYISAVPKELGASLVAGIATVTVATITVMVGRYFERKKELDALYRDKKMEIYDEFMKKFFDQFSPDSKNNPNLESDDLASFFREFMRKLILWSGPEPIAAFIDWKDHLAKGTPDAQTMYLTEKFLLSLRSDLRHSNKGIPKGFFASLFLKEGALFLAMAKEDPNVTLSQLAEVEKVLQENSKGASSTSF